MEHLPLRCVCGYQPKIDRFQNKIERLENEVEFLRKQLRQLETERDQWQRMAVGDGK